MAGTWSFTDAVAGASWSRDITWVTETISETGVVTRTPRDNSAATRGIFRLTRGDLVVEGLAIPRGVTGVISCSLTDEQTFVLLGRARFTVALVFGVDDVPAVLNGTFVTNKSALVPTGVL